MLYLPHLTAAYPNLLASAESKHDDPNAATIARGQPVCDATVLDARGQRNGGIDEGGRRARLPQPA